MEDKSGWRGASAGCRGDGGARTFAEIVGLSDFFVRDLASPIVHCIFGEGFHISTNQKQGNSAFSLLIG